MSEQAFSPKLVQTEDGKQLYFRFYDPRVLRLYLPTCTPEEVRRSFGPVGCYLLEDEDPKTLLRFTGDDRGARRASVPLSVPQPSGAARP